MASPTRPNAGWPWLDSAETLSDLAELRSSWPELLLGNRAGQHSIRINAHWHVCFRWTGEVPCNVGIADYH